MCLCRHPQISQRYTAVEPGYNHAAFHRTQLTRQRHVPLTGNASLAYPSQPEAFDGDSPVIPSAMHGTVKPWREVRVENLFRYVNALFAFIAPSRTSFGTFPPTSPAMPGFPCSTSFRLRFAAGRRRHTFHDPHAIHPDDEFRQDRAHHVRRQSSASGISALAPFMLGLAMRAGPGNIVGITGAISVGGPGALFWMWVAAGPGSHFP